MRLKRLRWGTAVYAFYLLLLVSQAASAVTFRKIITLSAFLDAHRAPRVYSTASAELVTDQGYRIYDPIIMGHSVADITDGRTIFDARIDSPSGYATTSTKELQTQEDLEGDYTHCYDAAVGAHSNRFNVHEAVFAPQDCIPPGPHDPPPIDPGTPVLIDLEMNGFHLSGPNPPVDFDIDADGVLDRVAWTSAGEDEAFLCLDRNGNGTIDDGSELFGDATPLLSGVTEESGYSALAEMDEPAAGGNDDGKVDASDSMFAALRAWVDQNRDGISQRREIHRLDEVGVVAFERRFKKMHRKDDFGNLFRYTSRVYMRSTAGGVISWPTYDVIFAVP